MSIIIWRPGQRYRLRDGKIATYYGVCAITGRHRAGHLSASRPDSKINTTVLYTDDGKCNRPGVDSPWDIVGEAA